MPASEATIWVRLDNNSLTGMFTLPQAPGMRTFDFNNGTRHSIEVMNLTFKGPSGARYNWNRWEQCGIPVPGGTAPMFHTPLMIANYTTPCPSQWNGPFTARFDTIPPTGCITNCLLEANTNIPTTDATISVRQDNNASLVYTLPHTFSFRNGTSHTIEVLTTSPTGSSGTRYQWNQWTQGTNQYPGVILQTPIMIYNYTTGASGPFTAQFNKQLSLTFTDSVGQPVSAPSSVTLTMQGSASTVTLSSYSNQWIIAAPWTVTDATWQGFSRAVLGSQTIAITTSSAAVQLRAYPATIKIVDKGNNPVPGAKVTVILLSNSTTITFTSDSQGIVQLGRIPGGLYSAQVTYQGQDMGRWGADASLTPTNTIQLNIGNAPGTSSQVSSIVLLTIFGIAFFLVLLAIKVRKPPPPPKI
ncbi:MAG TPA: carboxypeptidase-like regulatory domain-containing protein [Candidatus Bathyarchaeia archaeon]|nr:carboxypeptidase-like regulatory domain-containing protein [Candidatus Bathyarchaeia archaeon]